MGAVADLCGGWCNGIVFINTIVEIVYFKSNISK